MRPRLRARARPAGPRRLVDLRARCRGRRPRGLRRRSRRLHVGPRRARRLQPLREFDRLLDEIMGDDVLEHERSSYVRFDGRWVPVSVPEQPALPAAAGGVRVPPRADRGARRRRSARLRRLDRGTFGAGIAQHFMRPYNTKVWATPLETMSASWIAERVSVVDHRRALRNVLFGEDDLGWGPQHVPVSRAGGTGDLPSPRRPSAIACATGAGWTHWTSSAARSASPTAPSGSTARSSRRCRSTARRSDRRLPVGGARGRDVAPAQRRGWSASAPSSRCGTTAPGSTSPTRPCPSTA